MPFDRTDYAAQFLPLLLQERRLTHRFSDPRIDRHGCDPEVEVPVLALAGDLAQQPENRRIVAGCGLRNVCGPPPERDDLSRFP